VWRLWVLAAVALAVPAAGLKAAPLYRVACGTKTFLLVFSHERGVRVQVGQENVIRSTASNVHWSPECRRTDDFVTNWGGGPSRRTKAPTSIFCTVKVAAEFKVVNYKGPIGTGAAFAATLGHTTKMFVLAKLLRANSGSELRFDTQYCRSR
jgi:hypothetical protein